MKNKRPKGWRLTLVQINQARQLRFEHDLTWHQIGLRLGCHYETIRRAIDPDYDRERREHYKRRAIELAKIRQHEIVRGERRERLMRMVKPSSEVIRGPDEDFLTRRRTLKADAKFCEAMRTAINRRQESAPIGVDRRPSTERVRFAVAHGDVLAGLSSPGAMCVDS